MHEDLVKRALSAIQKVHADTSVDLETTLDSLLELCEEVNLLMRAVREDIDCEGGA